MKFKKGYCPKCGGPARYILEEMLVSTALDAPDGDGEFEYDSAQGYDDGDCGPEPVEDDKGRVELTCVQNHKWKTRFVEEKSKKGGGD